MWSCGTVSFRAVLYEALCHAHRSKPMPDRAVSRTNLAPRFSRCACTGRWGHSKEESPIIPRAADQRRGRDIPCGDVRRWRWVKYEADEPGGIRRVVQAL